MNHYPGMSLPLQEGYYNGFRTLLVGILCVTLNVFVANNYLAYVWDTITFIVESHVVSQ